MCGPSSQTSKGCDPPETPAPTAPETKTDDTRPDVLPSLYDDINTLTREVFLFLALFCSSNGALCPHAEGQATINAYVPCFGGSHSCRVSTRDTGTGGMNAVHGFIQHLYTNFQSYILLTYNTTFHRQSSVTDIPLYSVVDKSKKKKKATVSADAVRDVS